MAHLDGAQSSPVGRGGGGARGQQQRRHRCPPARSERHDSRFRPVAVVVEGPREAWPRAWGDFAWSPCRCSSSRVVPTAAGRNSALLKWV